MNSSSSPGKTYYIEVVPTKPIMMYADGDYYKNGYAYYERLKADRASGAQPYAFHSERWTLAMNIVTYANKGGAPLSPPPATAPLDRGGYGAQSAVERVAQVL